MILLSQDPQTKRWGVRTPQGFTPLRIEPLELPRQIVLRRNPMNEGNELERKTAQAARQYVERDHIPYEHIAYTASPAGMPGRDVAKEIRIDVYAVQLYKIVGRE